MYIHMNEEAIKSVADYYGLASQLKQLVEECSELSVATLHYFRNKDSLEKIYEEMADVMIMIRQIIYLLGDDYKEIEEQVDYKLTRQLGRIIQKGGVLK